MCNFLNIMCNTSSQYYQAILPFVIMCNIPHIMYNTTSHYQFWIPLPNCLVYISCLYFSLRLNHCTFTCFWYFWAKEFLSLWIKFIFIPFFPSFPASTSATTRRFSVRPATRAPFTSSPWKTPNSTDVQRKTGRVSVGSYGVKELKGTLVMQPDVRLNSHYQPKCVRLWPHKWQRHPNSRDCWYSCSTLVASQIRFRKWPRMVDQSHTR